LKEPNESAFGQSKVLRFRDFRWQGVEARRYKGPNDQWREVTRHPLVGIDEGTPFEVRYFEIAPAGCTAYERHEHEHVVVPIRGRGAVRLGDRWEAVSFGDVIYVAPDDPHQFRAVGDEPFGFLCVVAADRDPPVPL
jgi:quercetin dioxygenase-like cupin family protein